MDWITQLGSALSKSVKWWITVAPWEQAVLVRLGKHSRLLMPGVHFRVPFVDRVSRISVRERSRRLDNITVTTTDMKTITLGICIRHTVVDTKLLFESIAMPDATLEAVSQSSAAAYIASRSSIGLSPVGISAHATEEVGDMAKPWGIGSVEVCVISFAYTRAIRLLQAQDHGYSSTMDHNLDKDSVSVE